MNTFAKYAEKSSLFSIATGEAAEDESAKFYSNLYKKVTDARETLLNVSILMIQHKLNVV